MKRSFSLNHVVGPFWASADRPKQRGDLTQGEDLPPNWQNTPRTQAKVEAFERDIPRDPVGRVLITQSQTTVPPGEAAYVEVLPSDLPEHTRDVGTLFAEAHGDEVPQVTQAMRETSVSVFSPIGAGATHPN